MDDDRMICLYCDHWLKTASELAQGHCNREECIAEDGRA